MSDRALSWENVTNLKAETEGYLNVAGDAHSELLPLYNESVEARVLYQVCFIIPLFSFRYPCFKPVSVTFVLQNCHLIRVFQSYGSMSVTFERPSSLQSKNQHEYANFIAFGVYFTGRPVK